MRLGSEVSQGPGVQLMDLDEASLPYFTRAAVKASFREAHGTLHFLYYIVLCHIIYNNINYGIT